MKRIVEFAHTLFIEYCICINMVLDVSCDDCGDPLEEKGAILFSPPDEQMVQKTHLCRGCYRDIMDDIESED